MARVKHSFGMARTDEGMPPLYSKVCSRCHIMVVGRDFDSVEDEAARTGLDCDTELVRDIMEL